MNTHNNNFLFKKPSLPAMFQSGFQQILNYYEPLLVCFDMSQAITHLTALWQTFKHLQNYKSNLASSASPTSSS